MNYRYDSPAAPPPARPHDSTAPLVGAILGLPSVIGLIVNYVKRHDSPYVADSHHAWMIRTFWWALAWSIIGGITWIFLVGIPIVILAWLWYLYRHVRGLRLPLTWVKPLSAILCRVRCKARVRRNGRPISRTRNAADGPAEDRPKGVPEKSACCVASWLRWREHALHANFSGTLREALPTSRAVLFDDRPMPA